jgi:hypothetical protein
MLGVGYATAIAMGRRGFDLSGDLNAAADPLGVLVLPLGDLVSFGILVTAALCYRRRPEVHKRLMLLATSGALMAAPLAHLIAKFPDFAKRPTSSWFRCRRSTWPALFTTASCTAAFIESRCGEVSRSLRGDRFAHVSSGRVPYGTSSPVGSSVDSAEARWFPRAGRGEHVEGSLAITGS